MTKKKMPVNSNTEVKLTSEIRLKIGMNEEKIPIDIKWSATDSEHSELKDCKAMMLSVWDAVENKSLHIDLWTSKMNISEMRAHMFDSIMSSAETYERATQITFVAEAMQKACLEINEKLMELENELEKKS